MSLLNPFSGKGQGNSRERLNQLEMEVDRLKGAMSVYTTLFELQRRFFVEVSNAMSKPQVEPNKPEENTNQSPPVEPGS